MQPLQTFTDEELFSLIRQGNREAFALMYERYWQALYVKAYHRLRSKEAAEEIVQDLFVHLWLKRSTLSIQRSVAGYLFTALKHRIFNHFHAEITRLKHQQGQSPETDLDDSTQQQINYQDLLQSYTQTIANLPEKSKLIFELNRHSHYTMAQIAQQLSISPKTVEYHLGRSLQQLKKSLKEFLPLILFVSSWLQ